MFRHIFTNVNPYQLVFYFKHPIKFIKFNQLLANYKINLDLPAFNPKDLLTFNDMYLNSILSNNNYSDIWLAVDIINFNLIKLPAMRKYFYALYVLKNLAIGDDISSRINIELIKDEKIPIEDDIYKVDIEFNVQCPYINPKVIPVYYDVNDSGNFYFINYKSLLQTNNCVVKYSFSGEYNGATNVKFYAKNNNSYNLILNYGV